MTDDHPLGEEWSVRKMVEAIDLNRPGGSGEPPLPDVSQYHGRVDAAEAE